MLQTLLLILKILLWIILGLIGLVLVLLLLVLFAPIKYKVDVAKEDTAKITAKVSFLVVSVKVKFDQATKELENIIRICGIPLKIKDKPKKEKKRAKKTSEATEVTSKDVDIKEADAENTEQTIDTASKVENPDAQVVDLTNEETQEEQFDVFAEDEELTKEDKSFFVRVRKFFATLWSKVKGFFRFIVNLNPDTISDYYNTKTYKLRRTINRFKQFWNMKCTIKTRAYLKKYLVSIVKHIAPRKIKGYIKYGFDEPYKTGQITGYISMIPLAYQKNLVWEPDFYNKVMVCDLHLSGKIRIGYIARIVLNINIWKTIKRAKKIMA
ncbi:MAG: hypothetical protein IJX12_03665 [Lachnospiraceae bacterium]|nr:hypothetical protein [Lachnospiraceae bacterium]